MATTKEDRCEKVVRSFQLISEDSCFGPVPEPGTEIEQHLTISRTGRVWFSGYCCTEDYAGPAKLGRRKICRIDPSQAEKIVQKMASHFVVAPDCWATDIGMWGLTLRFTDGTVEHYRGSMCYNIKASIDGIPLTTYMRNVLPIENLFLFEIEYEE